MNGNDRIKDFYSPEDSFIAESKNVAYLSLTQQLKDYIDIATEMGTTIELYVRQNTVPSGPLQQAINDGLININYFDW